MTQPVRRIPPPSAREVQIEVSERPVRDVLVEVWENTETLIRQELQLATAELDVRIGRAKKEAAAVGVGGAVLYGGVLCLLATVILLLSLAMQPWVAALIVGIAAVGAGAASLMKARKDLQTEELAPRRTARTVKEDVRMFKEVTK